MGLAGGLFEWSVSTGSGPPAWTNFPTNFTFSGGQALSQSVAQYFSDPSGLVNTFALNISQSWLSVSSPSLNAPQINVTALDPVGVLQQVSITSTNTAGVSATTPLFTITVIKGVNRAPTWTNPGVINRQAGTTYNLAQLVSDLDADIPVIATVNPLVLPTGFSVNSAGILTIGSNVISGTYNFIFSAFDGTATTNSGTLSFSIQGGVILGTWSNQKTCITLVRGGASFDIATMSTGQNNVTWQMLPFASLPFLVPSGVTLSANLLSASAGATVTPLAGGPNFYAMFRQSDGLGGTVDTPAPVSIVVVDSAAPIYNTYAANGTTLLGGPFLSTGTDSLQGIFKAQAVATAGTHGTPGVPSTYDVIKVTPGNLPLTESWVPAANKMFRIISADSTLPVVKDFGGGGTTVTTLVNNGQAGSAPANYYWDVSGIWCRNGKPLDATLSGGDPSSMGGALRMTATCNSTQNLTVRDSIFEDCVEAEVSSPLMNTESFYNIRMINCGAATGSALCHGMYLHCNTTDIRGIEISWTYNYDMLPAGKKLWAGVGHNLKMRCPVMNVAGVYIKQTIQKSDGSVAYANVTELIDIANGGNLYVSGSILVEGLDSSYNPAYDAGGTRIDNHIIGYSAQSNKFPVNEVRLLQNTIVNYGQSTEYFLRWIASPGPGSSRMTFTQGGSIGTVDATARTFTVSSVSQAIANDSAAPQASGVRMIYRNGTGALGGVVNGANLWIGIIDDTHAALYNVKSDSLADINRIAITAPGNGLNWTLSAVADVYLLKDNVMLGTTQDGSSTLQSDGNTYGQDNTMGPVSQLSNSNPLAENYALTTPIAAAQNWVDGTGASDTYSPT